MTAPFRPLRRPVSGRAVVAAALAIGAALTLLALVQLP
jgi:hypothetical protein